MRERLLAATALLAGCAKEKHLEPSIQTVKAGYVAEIQPDAPERYSASIEPFAQVQLINAA
jgi:hypothetical protein